jgi:hypothetical protein
MSLRGQSTHLYLFAQSKRLFVAPFIGKSKCYIPADLASPRFSIEGFRKRCLARQPGTRTP